VVNLHPGYRGTSFIRNRAPLGPYSRTLSSALLGNLGEGLFLMSEPTLYSWSEEYIVRSSGPTGVPRP